MPRIIAMTQFRDFVIAVCDDGSLWRGHWQEWDKDFNWYRISGPEQKR